MAERIPSGLQKKKQNTFAKKKRKGFGPGKKKGSQEKGKKKKGMFVQGGKSSNDLGERQGEKK